VLTASCSRASSRRRSPGPEAPVERRLLEPAVEVLDAAVERRLPGGDEHGAGAEAQAQPNHPRQGTCRRPPAGQLAGVVQLHSRGNAEILPALPEEPEDFVPAAGLGQAQAPGAVKGVLAHPDVVAVAPPLAVDRPHQIDLAEVVRGAGRRAGVLPARQQGGRADPRRGPVVALRDAPDGALARGRPDAEALQLGEDGGGAEEAGAGGRRGAGLEPAADGEDGPLRLGRDALGDVAVGPGQVVEALGAGLRGTTPPLAEPDLGAADGGTDGPGGPASEA
jgi:hypothetical protein